MIKSVKKAMDILTLLSSTAESPIPLNEIALRTGLNKSTCAHILDTMCDSQYVERISRKEGYRLGPWSYMLSRYGTYCQSLINTSSSVLKWLNKQTDAAVFISVLCNGRKYIVHHIESNGILPMSDGSMIQGYLEPTATGRLLMAYLDQESLNHVFNKGTGKNALSAEMEEELKKIRSNGYAHVSVDSEHNQSFAFRVTSGTKTVASVGVLYSNVHDSEEFREHVIKSGMTAAKEISRRLNFT